MVESPQKQTSNDKAPSNDKADWWETPRSDEELLQSVAITNVSHQNAGGQQQQPRFQTAVEQNAEPQVRIPAAQASKDSSSASHTFSVTRTGSSAFADLVQEARRGGSTTSSKENPGQLSNGYPASLHYPDSNRGSCTSAVLDLALDEALNGEPNFGRKRDAPRGRSGDGNSRKSVDIINKDTVVPVITATVPAVTPAPPSRGNTPMLGEPVGRTGDGRSGASGGAKSTNKTREAEDDLFRKDVPIRGLTQPPVELRQQPGVGIPPGSRPGTGGPTVANNPAAAAQQAKTGKKQPRTLNQFDFMRKAELDLQNRDPGWRREKEKTFITMEEVAKHKSRHDAWMVLGGNVYDVTSYAQYHPGGKGEVLRGAGKDATALYNEVHPWVAYDAILKSEFLGKLSHAFVPPDKALGNASGKGGTSLLTGSAGRAPQPGGLQIPGGRFQIPQDGAMPKAVDRVALGGGLSVPKA